MERIGNHTGDSAFPSPGTPSRSPRSGGGSLLHSLVAGAAGREHRDGTEIAGSYAAAMVMPVVPPRPRLLHPRPPEHFLYMPVVLLQHLVDVT